MRKINPLNQVLVVTEQSMVQGFKGFRFYLAANSSIMSQIIVMASDFVESSIALM